MALQGALTCASLTQQVSQGLHQADGQAQPSQTAECEGHTYLWYCAQPDRGLQELRVGSQVFPFQTQAEKKACEVVRLPAPGSGAPALELGCVRERAFVKVWHHAGAAGEWLGCHLNTATHSATSL